MNSKPTVWRLEEQPQSLSAEVKAEVSKTKAFKLAKRRFKLLTSQLPPWTYNLRVKP